MDWKIFSTAFASILVAELADKTQLMGLSLSAKSGKPLSVLAGSVLAYIVVTVATVTIGVALSKFIKPEIVRYAGGAIFIFVGILMFFGRI